MRRIETAVGRCRLRRSQRRTLAISVMPTGAVEIVAPEDASLAAILEKVSKRSGWIFRQRQSFRNMRVESPKRRYCTGATHRYLGRQYRLKIIVDANPNIKIRGAYLQIETRSASKKAVSIALSQWIRERAVEQFERRLAKWRKWCADLGLPKPKLFVRGMPKRWGSAHPNGRIYLNPELVRTPSPCIDYVIAHEICHIKHPRHDKAFYIELEKLCPNWKKTKQRLEEVEI
jgi:predicted metal-dependent hydrolase